MIYPQESPALVIFATRPLGLVKFSFRRGCQGASFDLSNIPGYAVRIPNICNYVRFKISANCVYKPTQDPGTRVLSSPITYPDRSQPGSSLKIFSHVFF